MDKPHIYWFLFVVLIVLFNATYHGWAILRRQSPRVLLISFMNLVVGLSLLFSWQADFIEKQGEPYAKIWYAFFALWMVLVFAVLAVISREYAGSSHRL